MTNSFEKEHGTASENVSSYSIPYFWEYPLVTNITLYLSILPSTLNMVLYNYLQCMGTLSLGSSFKSHVSFFIIEFYYSRIASLHSLNYLASS